MGVAGLIFEPHTSSLVPVLKWDPVFNWSVHLLNGTQQNCNFKAFGVMNIMWTNFLKKT